MKACPEFIEGMKKAINFILLFLVGCSNIGTTQTITPSPMANTSLPTRRQTLEATQTPFATSTPQPHYPTANYGPDDFPSNINPLTGREVLEPNLLQLPAVLVSISNSPASARPQAGPGFAPWVFELFIGEGATRFMNVFYGDIPRDVSNIIGDCEVREEIIRPNGDWIGNRVWLDENKNGIQDDWEMGVGGVCIMLYKNGDYEHFWVTTTDSNGYYAFDLPKDSTGLPLEGDYELRFDILDTFQFTKQNIGNEDTDSDVDPATKQTPTFKFSKTDTSWDAGLVLSEGTIATPKPDATSIPTYIPSETYVGPIRSGRLTYNQIGAMFPNSCLVYASAAWDIGERLDACEIVFGVDKTTPNSALLTVSRLRELALENLNTRQPVNYSGNLFSYSVPEGGQSASEIGVFYHAYNQSAWTYDPISQTYLRFTDDADGKGILHPATDRLTERQLAYENVIVVFAEHMRFRHNQFEVNFGNGQSNVAYLFRDGQAFKIEWTTTNREYEKTSGLRRPMHFVDGQGNLVPLHPGRTWIHIVTPFSSVTEEGNAEWLVKFVQPYDPPDTPVP
jgi:hypothetical protein